MYCLAFIKNRKQGVIAIRYNEIFVIYYGLDSFVLNSKLYKFNSILWDAWANADWYMLLSWLSLGTYTLWNNFSTDAIWSELWFIIVI